ncbi:MAG: YraN family protein, partial [Calditrichia bacterium]
WDKKAFGKWGEDIAEKYLREKGFSIITRNFRAERGEIDIVARDGDCVVFVEVKTGNSHKFGPPEERITMAKRRQLYKIASHYIQQNPGEEVDYRFDAVIIDGTQQKYEIRYYKNAFYF